jgi:serine/threonine protein kinase
VLGTPEYIAPEQARGRDVDPRADLYSLGVMAYEMVLGRLPFLSDNPADAIQMHLTASPPKPRILWPEIPPALEKILLGLLAKEPDARPSLAALREVLAALKPAIAMAPLLERVADAPPPRPVRKTRHLVRLLAVGATFVGLVAFGYRPERGKTATANERKIGHARADSEAAPPASMAAVTRPPSQNALAPVAAPPTPASSLTPAPVKKRRRKADGNYLLDPFASH